MQAVGGQRTRSWDDIHAIVLPQIAAVLGVRPEQIRLPHAIEWNFLGNFLGTLLPLPVPSQAEPALGFGPLAQWEWTESRYGESHRLLVGRGGLDAVGWCFAGDQWYNSFTFRSLVVL